ncbi:MAG TPA: hypothetical protein VGO50_10675 [Pyrinomonadaceae bacterium]|nr:hypothetical protein [Pyrinomonadaceae bacterium]
MGAIQEKINSGDGEMPRQTTGGAFFFSSPKFVLLLMAVHLAVALPLAYALNIWVDEASTLYTTQNISHALNHAMADELQAPLYFWVLSVWRQIDGSIFFARLFSTLCSLASIKVAFDVARRFLPEYARKFAPVIVAIFALHPLLFWASTEVRGYALVVLLSGLLLRFFYDAYLAEKPALKDRAIYIAIAVVALYTNYFLGFILVGNFCALLALRKFRLATHYLGHMAIVGALFSPLGYALSGQLETRSQMGDRSFFESVRTLWQHLQTFLLPVNIFSEEANIPAFLRLWIFRLSAAGITIYLWAKRFKGLSDNTIALGIISLIPALFLLAVVWLLGSGYANIRHASLLLLPVIMFFSALLYEAFSKKGLLAWALLLAFFIPFAGWQEFTGLVKRGDWEKAAAYIQANEKPGQTILLFKPYDSLAFKIYYKGPNTVLPGEGFFTWSQQNHFNFTEAAAALDDQTDSLISQIPPGTGEVWLLTGEICDNPKTLSFCCALEEYFDSNYTMVDSKEFYLEKIRLYRKK